MPAVTSTMTPRERVRAFFSREETDRVCINYAANPQIDRRLKAHYGLKPDQNAELLEILGVDFRGVWGWSGYTGPKLHEDIPDRQIDMWGVRTKWMKHENGGYWDFCDFPLQDATLDDVDSWPFPNPDHFDYSCVARNCEQHDSYGLFAGGAGVACVINRLAKLRGMEQILVDLLTDDPVGLRLIERKQDTELEMTRRAIEAGRDRIDFLWIGEDLGTQIGPMISLDLYRKHIRAQHAKFVDMAKSYGLPVMIHTCGSSSFAYEDFIEMGIDAVETLQPEAHDMSPRYLKDAFGGRLSFHGCLSTSGPMTYGTPDDVREDVRVTLETMMPGGGYCAAPTHQIQDNTPTGNVVALYEAIHEYGRY
jgi:uroporphyrinogen decarboxylase